MKRCVALAAAVIAAFVFTMPTAEAGGRGRIAKEVKVAAIVTGAAATATYFSLNAWNWRWDNAYGMTSLAVYGATRSAASRSRRWLAPCWPGVR